MATAAGAPSGFRTFSTIWAGQFVSIIGSALTNFGIGIWIFQHTQSSWSFAWALIATALPGILLSPIAGALADRWDRRIAMLVSDVGAGLSSLLLVLLVLSGNLNLFAVYALMAVSSAFGCLSWPAMTATTSLLVPKENLGRANGMLQLSEAAALILGPALGGGLMKVTGLQGLIIADVASFCFGILTLLIVRVPKPVRTGSVEEPSLLREALFGWTYIKARKGLLGIMLFFLLINFSMGLMQVVLTPMMLTYFDPATLGVMASISGFGMLAGSVLMSAWGGPKRRVLGLMVFAFVGGQAMMAMSARPNVWLLTSLMFLFIASAPIANGCSQAIWQSKVAADVQGRVFATRRMFAWMMTPVAYAVSGKLADHVFLPAMRPGGALAPALGPIFGVDAGAGYRIMLLLTGALTMLVALVAWANPHFRNVESELPDARHQIDDGLPKAAVPLDDAADASDRGLHVG